MSDASVRLEDSYKEPGESTAFLTSPPSSLLSSHLLLALPTLTFIASSTSHLTRAILSLASSESLDGALTIEVSALQSIDFSCYLVRYRSHLLLFY